MGDGGRGDVGTFPHLPFRTAYIYPRTETAHFKAPFGRRCHVPTSPRPQFKPGMTPPLQGLPGLAQCNALPTCQFLTPP